MYKYIKKLLLISILSLIPFSSYGEEKKWNFLDSWGDKIFSIFGKVIENEKKENEFILKELSKSEGGLTVEKINKLKKQQNEIIQRQNEDSLKLFQKMYDPEKGLMSGAIKFERKLKKEKKIERDNQIQKLDKKIDNIISKVGSTHINEIKLKISVVRWVPIGDKTIDEDDSDNDDEETVDRVEKIRVQSSETKKSKPTDAEKRRISRIIKKLVGALTANDYLKERPLQQLMADLSIISLLLRSGLKEGWIDHSDFLLFTHNVWSKLFFSSEAKLNSNGLQVGWLEYRYNTCTDKAEFIEQLTDTRLSTAMTAWALALNEPTGKSEEALFIISCGISIAKFPWLWIGSNPENLAEELQKELVHTGELGPGDEQKWELLCEQRENLIKWGFALRKIDKVLTDIAPGEVKDKISRRHVKKGELLWQGKGIGLCIAGQDCDRMKDGKITVHCLQYEKQDASFAAPYIIPLECIFTENLITETGLNKTEKDDIKNLIGSLTGRLESSELIN